MAVNAIHSVPLVKHKRTSLERAEKFISPDYFKDVNLFGKLYPDKRKVSMILHRAVGKRTKFNDAVGPSQEFKEVQIGQSFGPTWSTHWFHVKFQVPDEWVGQEVHLQWNSGSEAMVWSVTGNPLQGLNKGERKDFILTKCHTKAKKDYEYFIEMAANGMFGAGDYLIGPPKPDMTFQLSQCDIVIFDRDVYNLMLEIELLIDMVKHLDDEDQRAYQALHTVNHMVNLCTMEGKNGYPLAREVAKKFFCQQNGASQFTLHVMGHCHIDTAWLWPYSETVRKCARSWSSTLQLMEEYPNYTFVCSQAQQFEWVKENYPSLYQSICAKVKEGRFLPVGGTWVEMDGNLPSGEAFVRQFLYGQKFFMSEFGIKCSEFWLPDTFGYSAQLPQIMRGAGMNRFVTQKMSWSLVNKFPHNTFLWQGLDGSKCLAHFPPADTYNARANIEEILKALKGNKDKGRTNHGLFLYGHGDGGGGPTGDMLERILRLKDTDGIPRLKFSSPSTFFQEVESKEQGNLCTWVGELYLELHQGTFTTQAQIKRLNRKLEIALQNTEKISSLLLMEVGEGPPTAKVDIEQCWKGLLLNQFHDVLPGSCIGEVVKDALKIYKDIYQKLTGLFRECTRLLLAGMRGRKRKADEAEILPSELVTFNPHSWERKELVKVPSQLCLNVERKLVRVGKDWIGYVSVPSVGVASLGSIPQFPSSSLAYVSSHQDGMFMLENRFLQAKVDSAGRILSLIHKPSKMEAILTDNGFLGNQFCLYDDVPLFWDAWDIMDYHQETRMPLSNSKEAAKICVDAGIICSISFALHISERSHIVQMISLDAESPYLKFTTTVSWHENHKLLKVEFPFNVHTSEATFDIQFGHLKRPSHSNTSWDWARYEVVGHKWADVSQHGFGVALLNDCKYGHSVRGSTMSLSLIRAPKSPDDKADMGDHQFSYAVFPHSGSFQDAGVIQAAYDFNNPLQIMSVANELQESVSYFNVDNPAVILDTVKVSENNKGVVLRFFEAFGSQVDVSIYSKFEVTKAVRCNLLEEIEGKPLVVADKHSFQLTFKPFEIITVQLFV